jgi:hypothetical protein
MGLEKMVLYIVLWIHTQLFEQGGVIVLRATIITKDLLLQKRRGIPPARRVFHVLLGSSPYLQAL